jgi:hypothetical protein
VTQQNEPLQDRSTPSHRASVEWLPADLERLRVTRALERPLADVNETLRVRPEQVLQLAYGQDGQPNGAVISLSLHPSIPWLRVPVRVQCFTPAGDHHGAVISIRWSAERGTRIFPTMDADLAVLQSGPGASELVLEGRYRPPLGLVGLIVDRIIGRWVASATAKTFLDRLADCIEQK